MQGLELSEKYFEEYGMSMLKNDFSDILPFVAVGLVGSGSECFGFDDETSTDHDFEPSFCIFIPEDERLISRKRAFELEKAYNRLPAEFLGFKRQKIKPAGGARRGVTVTEAFYRSKTGTPDGKLSTEAWCRLPEYSLAEAVNGKVFLDNYGEFTKIRERISKMPSDIVLKKLAGSLAMLAQCGEYNYLRCISHGETGAAQLTLFEFEKAASSSFFLLAEKYQPYFKWKYRAMRATADGTEFSDNLEFLISSANGYENIPEKLERINLVSDFLCKSCIEKFSLQSAPKPEEVAFALNAKINDPILRNESIFYCV